MQGIVWLKLLFYVMTAPALSSCILLLTDSQWGQNYFDAAFDFFHMYVFTQKIFMIGLIDIRVSCENVRR